MYTLLDILGNLGRIDYVSDFEYDLYIRSDSCNPRHRFWFNFTIDNVRLDQVIFIVLINYENVINTVFFFRNRESS